MSDQTTAAESRPQSPLVELRHLYVSFGRQSVLADISLSIKQGQTVAIIGESR